MNQTFNNEKEKKIKRRKKRKEKRGIKDEEIPRNMKGKENSQVNKRFDEK